ncbi:DUF6101 family protein [Pararhizobium sp. IMCC21322]|uniref:DUF6101 family protein n=1 Tax=Pararhizobium sp. IMCC21322 TaxID=3067903 RepID=UPI002742301F|nr:DUF6101 family protein [Pararhizobium sp. IMCC21322]
MNVRNFIGIVAADKAYANDNICEGHQEPDCPKQKPLYTLRNRIDPRNVPYSGPTDALGLVHLDAERVVIRHRLSCGLELNVKANIKNYEMVAVRILSSYEGDHRIFARLELVHNDADLNIVLAEAECPEHLAVDWAAWSQMLNLPLRLIDLEGNIVVPPGALDVSKSEPLPRRFGNSLAKRRTRFHTKRQIGIQGSNVVMFSPASEIIARH